MAMSMTVIMTTMKCQDDQRRVQYQHYDCEEEMLTPVVETVKEAETEEELADNKLPQPSTNRQTIPTPPSPQQPEYDPMADKPPPAITIPSYVPLHKKNKHWGDPFEPTICCGGSEFIRIYSQNQNGISDSTGLKYDDTFKHMKEAVVSMFSVNKTHADKMNLKNNKVLETSRRRSFNYKEGEYCSVVTLSSMAPITCYTKPGGNKMEIIGPLISRMRRRIEDKYEQWCGFVLLGKDNREILVLAAYNVPQDTPAGDDTLHAQQTSLYLLDGEVNPNPWELFIRDLHSLITTAIKENQDIILMGDFNEVCGDNQKMMAKILSEGKLTGVHAHKHGHANIATYIQGRRRVDYCFVSPRILDHVFRCGIEAFHARKVCNHCGLFVHLSMIELFGWRLPTIINPAERCIRSNHPRIVRKYVLKLALYFEYHNIVREVKEAQHDYSYEAVEKLDELVTAGMLHAEQECRNNVRLPWS